MYFLQKEVILLKRHRAPHKTSAWLRDHRPEIPTPTPKKPAPFPPAKRHTDLHNLFVTNGNSGYRLSFKQSACFEDLNHLYFLDYGEQGSRLTFALDKNLYLVDLSYTKRFFEFANLWFDSRFAFGQNFYGAFIFGHYKDANLGRIFYVTEPKDASHVLFRINEYTNRLDWLDSARHTEFFYHNPHNFCLYTVLPVGARLDEDKQLVITYCSKALEDRQFYQGLFEEQLRHFADLPVEFTEFKVKTTDPTPEELAAAKLKKQAETEHTDKLFRNILQVIDLLEANVHDLLDEFDLSFTLNRDREFFKIGPREIVKLSLFKFGKEDDVIWNYSIDSETFLVYTPEAAADLLMTEIKNFLEEHREAFEAYRKIYTANQAFHDLVDPNSMPPVLDYPHIFETTLLFKRRRHIERTSLVGLDDDDDD